MDRQYKAYLLGWLTQHRLSSSQNNVLHAGEALNSAAQHTRPEVSAEVWDCRPRGFLSQHWEAEAEKVLNQSRMATTIVMR